MQITEDDVTGTEASTKWQTRSGRKVRIYAVDGCWVHGAIQYGSDWEVARWGANSKCSVNAKELDLVPISNKREPLVGWLYRVEGSEWHWEFSSVEPSSGREVSPARS